MISAALVKELREKTGAGMMDCKKALEENDGDLNKATDWLREKGIAKAAKKMSRIAAEGAVSIEVAGNTALILEMNTETDFVAKNAEFTDLLAKITKAVLAQGPSDVEAALALELGGESIADLLMAATAKSGEKISLRRFERVNKTDEDIFGRYIHFDGKTAVIAVLRGGSEEIAKDIAMQVASMSPTFISRDDADEEYLRHEREIQKNIIANDETQANKPEAVLEKILEGRLSKALQEVCLLDQTFFRNPDLKVGQYLKEANAQCLYFVRYLVGEGIEKKSEDFAAEVASMM